MVRPLGSGELKCYGTQFLWHEHCVVRIKVLLHEIILPFPTNHPEPKCSFILLAPQLV